MADALHIFAELKSSVYVHSHQLRQRSTLPCLVRQPDIVGRLRVPRTAAVRAGYIHVRQKLHIQTDNACSVTALAAKRACIVRKSTGLIFMRFGIWQFGVKLAQIIVNACIGGDSRADVDADRRSINELYVLNPLSVNGTDMLRQRLAVNRRSQRRYKAFQNHCGFTGTGYTGDNRQPALRNIYLQWLNGMYRCSSKMNGTVSKQLLLLSAAFPLCRCLSGKERADLRSRICFNLRYRSLRNYMATAGACLRSHFHKPVCFLQNLRIVVHKDYRVAVCHQVMHYAGQSHDIGRMQTD